MRYKNPYYKKTKRAFDMVIACNHCSKDIALYRKQGKGALLRLWLSRLVESDFKPDPASKDLACPYCGQVLGSLVQLDGDYAYKVHRSALATRRKD